MNTNYNRIKVSDLETNVPNKILITNENGELEFNHISNVGLGAGKFKKENFEFTGSKIFTLSQPALNVLTVVVDGITLNGTPGAPLQYRMNNSTSLEILDEMIVGEDFWVSITYNYTGSIDSNSVKSVTGDGVDNTDPQNPVVRINAGAIIEDQIVEGVTDKGASQNAVFNALSLKADDSNVLHRVSNESFTGTKSVNNSGSNLFNGMIFNQVYGSGTPLRSINSDSGSAIELINNGNGQAAFITNYASGTGVNVFNNGSGNGLYVNNNGSGNGVQINITGTTNPNKKSLLISDNTGSNNGYLISLEYGSNDAASLPFRITRAGTTTYSITNNGVVTASSFKTPTGLPTQSLQADGSLFDLSLKVDKVSGKSLLADSEITRLGTLSNYTHPATHAPAIIIQDSDNRFVTDIEKATWNAKQVNITPGTATQYFRGDKTWQNLDKSAVGLANVDNTADAAKNVLSANKLTTARTINGVSFDGSANITINAADSIARIPAAEKGVANGVATLDSNGIILTTQLPSYVDDVLEFTNLAAFPATGETGKIYIAKDTNKTYRWSGTAYIFITSGAVDSVAGRTGVVTLAKADVGLASVDNTADAAKSVLSANKLTTARTINGASFDGSANITINAADSIARIPAAEKGVANGVATLDSNGIILTTQLPSYVDDVLEFTNLTAFPATGETGKIYIAKDTNKMYRWSGTAYVLMTSGAVDSVAGRTGVVTLAKADVGLASVDNTSDLNKPISTAAQTALNAKQATLTSGVNIKTLNGNTLLGSGDITVGLPSHLEYSTADLTIWNNGKGNIATNTAFGDGALSTNTSGMQMVAVGKSSLLANTTGYMSTAIGSESLKANTSGYYNVAVGTLAVAANTTGNSNVGVGAYALQTITDAYRNVALGTGAMQMAPSGNSNIAIGAYSLSGANTGSDNIAIGDTSLSNNTSGKDNTAVGRLSLWSNTIGKGNTAFGYNSLSSNTTGENNVASGKYSLGYNKTGIENVAIGYSAGQFWGGGTSNPNNDSSNSIYIGSGASGLAAGGFSEIVIGSGAIGAGSSTTTIGNQWITKTILRGQVSGGSFKVDAMNSAPASATATGTIGEIRFTSSAIYVCIATNTWVKSALATW